MIAAQPQNIVLCEGYDDRAMLAGIFEYLGWKSMRRKKGAAVDAWGESIDKGDFGYEREGAPILRLQATEGLPNLERAAKLFLGQIETKPLASLTLVRDDDTLVGTRELDVAAWVSGLFQRTLSPLENAPSSFDVHGVRVHVVSWRTKDTTPSEGVPAQQTLERVVCTALASVHAGRAGSVERWLDDAPQGTGRGPKSYSGSYVAKWYAEDRLDAFYKRLMTQDGVREAIRAQLEHVWYVFERLAV